MAAFLEGYEKCTSLLVLDPSFLPVNRPGGRGFLKGSKSEASAGNLEASVGNRRLQQAIGGFSRQSEASAGNNVAAFFHF